MQRAFDLCVGLCKDNLPSGSVKQMSPLNERHPEGH